MAHNYVGHRKTLHGVPKPGNQLGQWQMKHNAEKYRVVHIRSNFNYTHILQNMKWVYIIQEDVSGEAEYAVHNISSIL